MAIALILSLAQSDTTDVEFVVGPTIIMVSPQPDKFLTLKASYFPAVNLASLNIGFIRNLDARGGRAISASAGYGMGGLFDESGLVLGIGFQWAKTGPLLHNLHANVFSLWGSQGRRMGYILGASVEVRHHFSPKTALSLTLGTDYARDDRNGSAAGLSAGAGLLWKIP